MLFARLRCSPRPSLPTPISSALPSTLRRSLSQHSLATYLISPTALHSALRKANHSHVSLDPRLIPLCASWFLPNDSRDGYATFLASRIPHARFFDLDAVKDPHSPYPHMLPSAQEFAEAMRRMGIRREDSVVVYDSAELGIFSAPRVAWTLRVFGHPHVHVLNNFRLWVEQGLPTENGEPAEVKAEEYAVPELDAARVVAFEEVREVARDLGKEGAEEVQILDARSEGRWRGVEPEPREGLSSGHIPHSTSLPISTLLDPTTKAFLPADQLRAVVASKNIDPSKPIISSCGTGVTAAVIDAALTEAGFPEQGRRLYDGSWTEWAQRVTPSEGLIRKEE